MDVDDGYELRAKLCLSDHLTLSLPEARGERGKHGRAERESCKGTEPVLG